MKFTVVKNIKSDNVMRPILSSVLFFTVIYLISDFFVKHSSFGLSTDAIKTTLLGDEEQFLDPIGENIFLEFWHTEIFFIMMICFIVSTIYIRISSASKLGLVMVNLMLISSIVSLIALPLSYFYSTLYIHIYVVSFFMWHLIALTASLISLKAFYYA